MNTNLFHNVANLVTLLVAGITGVLLASGCMTITANGASTIDCSMSWIDPKYALLLIAVLQVAKFSVNFTRDGFWGVFWPQPPVVAPNTTAPNPTATTTEGAKTS